MNVNSNKANQPTVLHLTCTMLLPAFANTVYNFILAKKLVYIILGL